jgi:hypothetical protein
MPACKTIISFSAERTLSLSICNCYIFHRFIAQHQGIAGFSKEHVLEKEQAVNGHGREFQGYALLADPNHRPLRGYFRIALRLFQPDQTSVSGLLRNAAIDKNAAKTEIADSVRAAFGVEIKKDLLLHVHPDEMTTVSALHARLLKEKTLKTGCWPCIKSMQQSCRSSAKEGRFCHHQFFHPILNSTR